MAINLALYARSYKEPEVGVRGASPDDVRFLRGLLRWLLFAMLSSFLGGVLLMGRAARDHLSFLTSSSIGSVLATQETFSGNVSTCPGRFCEAGTPAGPWGFRVVGTITEQMRPSSLPSGTRS